MTDAEIIEMFEGLVDDSLDETLQISLANTAKNRLERELKLLIHQKGREPQSTSVGQTYSTAITLPADFRTWVSLYRGVQQLREVPFAHRAALRSNSSDAFYTDMGNSTYHLTGVQGSIQTLIETYIRKTDDITTSTVSAGSSTLTWPTEFRPLLPYEMAKVYYAIDAGDKARAWDDRWSSHYELLKRAMIDWDTDLKLSAQDNSTSAYTNFDSENRVN